MCSGSTASRPPPQATPTPGRQANVGHHGQLPTPARQATGARRPANGLAASHTSTRPAPDSELSGDTHRPHQGAPHQQQPPDHPNRVDTDSANRDTRRKPRGTSQRFESTQKHRRQCNPVTAPCWHEISVSTRPRRAPRAARGTPSLASAPYRAAADQPPRQATTKTLPL